MTQSEITQQYDEALPRPVRRRRLGWRWTLAVLAILAGAVGARWLLRTPEISVAQPVMREVVQTLTVTGSVRGAQESALSPELAGLLMVLRVEEGDRVQAGQELARISSAVLNAEQAQAVAAVRSMEAQLNQARADTRVVNAQRTQARAEVSGAEREAAARLAQAQARLRELEAGGTPESRHETEAAVREVEIRVAQAKRDLARAITLAEANATATAAVAQARAAQREAEAGVARANSLLASAQRELTRAEDLFAQGAIARARLDAARTAMETAREDVRSAVARKEQTDVEVARQQQVLAASREADVERARTELAMASEALLAAQVRLRTVSSPARAELIAQQQSAVQAAAAALATARQAGVARIETVDRTPTGEREAVARRRLEEAQRALDTVLTRVHTTEIRAPYAGNITDVLARPGMSVGPSQPLVRLAEMRAPEVVIDVDERDVIRVAVGQMATLVAEADPDRPVQARVTRIGARADTQRGVVSITLRPTEPATWLRSGMTVDATLVLAAATQQLVIPTSAVRRQQDAATVLVVEKGHVTTRQVTLGASAAGGTVVMAGLTDEAMVVVEPAETRVSAKVKPVLRVDGAETKER